MINQTSDARYKPYTRRTMDEIEQLKNLPAETIEVMKTVSLVLPFKTNNYVINKLINWNNIPKDPIFQLTFPQKGMLLPRHYERIENAASAGRSPEELKRVANGIRRELNPHPAGQKNHNIPMLDGQPLLGVQHKYRETVLFFPSKGQTCHAFCSFCFRWPQFTGIKEEKFAMQEVDLLIEYLHRNDEVQDVLLTGGDPMTMSAANLEKVVSPLLEAGTNLKTIRIGTKSLTYWPYRYTTDRDAEHVLQLFTEVSDAKMNLAIMAHFNHFNELRTKVLKEATDSIRKTGAQIRTQSPLMRHINTSPKTWTRMWRMQVDLGMIPYYMFVARDTGAQHYFAVPLIEAWDIFRRAYQRVSGICRTVRGPSMSATPGKIEVIGPAAISNKKVLGLRFIQGRNPDWVGKPFFAEYNPRAVWLDQLKPAFGTKFFYERELEKYLAPYNELKPFIQQRNDNHWKATPSQSDTEEERVIIESE